jgi:hypothetical protein
VLFHSVLQCKNVMNGLGFVSIPFQVHPTILILGLDLTKFKSVVCWYTMERTQAEFETG